MPGKYLEFIRAGRHVVPVEITFLKAEVSDDLSSTQINSSKWADLNDWKEIRILLKPAVEGCLKYNDTLPEKVPKTTHTSFGQGVGIGYSMAINKDKSPFLSVLDPKKNCWTDDEDDEVDENTGFQNYGGSFKSFTPTKLYLRVVILRKSFSNSDDAKRIQKFLGGKAEDIRSYYECRKSPTTHVDSSTEPIASTKDKAIHSYREKLIKDSASGRDHIETNIRSMDYRYSHDNNQRKYPFAEKVSIGRSDFLGTGRWSGSRKNSTSPQKTDSFWTKLARKSLDDSLEEERVDDFDDEEVMNMLSRQTCEEHQIPVPFIEPEQKSRRRVFSADDDDDSSDSSFSLPEIDAVPSKSPEKVEKKYSSVESPRTKLKSPTSESYTTSPLDFNILRPTANSVGVSKLFGKHCDSAPSSSISPQKRKNYHMDQTVAPTTFEEAISSVEYEMRKEKMAKKTKIAKSSPQKVHSPTRKAPQPSLAKSKPPKIGKAPRGKSLTLPVYFSNKQKTQMKTQKPPTKNPSPMKRSSLSPQRSVAREKSPAVKVKIPKKPNRRTRKHNSKSVPVEPDPEMPVLKKMVYCTEPTPPRSPMRMPKIEPVGNVREEPKNPQATVTEIVDVENQEELERPKEQQKRITMNRDEETQTVSSDKDTPNTVESPPDGTIQEEANVNTATACSLSILSEEFPVIITDEFEKSLEDTSNFSSAPNPDFSDEDDESNLFSFEHLSKICASNVMPKLKTIPPVAEPLEVDELCSTPGMMPPPVKRPPRTPKKFPPKPAPPVASTSLTITNDDNRLVRINGAVQPSEMTTHQLLSNKNTIMTAVNLLSQLMSKKLTTEEVSVRLGLQEKRRERSLSPDICLGPSKAKKPPEDDRKKLRSKNATLKTKGPTRTLSDSLDDAEQLGLDRQGGEAFFREVISRNDNTQLYVPEGDQYDLSQRSVCNISIYPDYVQKSRNYKMHCKSITDLNTVSLKEHFTTISPQILLIFEEKLVSERHQLYLENKRDKLSEINLCLPFNTEDAMVVMELLYDLLRIDKQERSKWSHYVNFVMLPESLMRIYAHVNEISPAKADTEMRFGGCYDDGDHIQQ